MPHNDETKLRHLMARMRSAWQVKDQWRSQHTDAYEFALPMRNLYTTFSKGAIKTDRVFDSTAITSTIKFANRLSTDLTPPFQTWALLTPGALVPPSRKEEIAAILEEVTKVVFAAIQRSAFDTASNEAYLDLAVGTFAMLVREGDDENPLDIVCVPYAQIAIDDGPGGSVDGVFREFKIKVRSIERNWASFKLDLGTALAKKLDENPEEEVTLHEITVWDDDEKAFMYRVLWQTETSTDKTTPHELLVVKYLSNPWIITRWVRVAGESTGRGPLLYALPDIKTLNKVKEFVLKNASIAISGIWAAKDDGVINVNTIKIRPGAIIKVAQQGNFAPLQTGGNFDVAALIISDLQDSIKRALFDQSLPPDMAQPRTATEIIARLKELQSDIGAPFGRLMREFITPFMQRVINVLVNKGMLQDAVKIDGLVTKVSVISPLAKQQNLNDLDAVVQWLTIMNGAVGPQAMQLGAKVEDIPEYIGEKLGVPLELMRNKQERQKIIEQGAALVGSQAQAGGIDLSAQQGAGVPQQQQQRAA